MKILKIILLNLLILSSLLANDFQTDAQNLLVNSFSKKESVIKDLTKSYKDDDNLEFLLQKLLIGDLYFVKESKQIVYLKSKKGKNYLTVDIFTKEELKEKIKYDFQKVKINNKLRSVIKSSLAKLNLSSKDLDKRVKSAKNLLKNLTNDDKEIIVEALESEKNSSVRDILDEANTILIAKNSSGKEKLEAVKKLVEFLSPTSFQTLKQLQSSENDKELKEAIADSLDVIEMKKSIYSFIETAFFGLSLGSVLLLAAIGLAITFGVMKVINMAHGELIMIGAYTTYTIQQIMPGLIEYSIIIAIPAVFIVSGLVGILIERLVIRHLYGRPLETLLATFGISLVLQQVVRTIYSPLNQEVKTPSWLSGALEINSALSLTYNRLYIVIFAVIIFLFVATSKNLV